MIPPGSTIGILGGGQLGRMLILAGRTLGYRFYVYEPNGPCAAGQVADGETNASYEDTAALQKFAESVDLITLEFENIPAAVIDQLSAIKPVLPGRLALHTCQHRQREKDFLKANDFPCAPFEYADSADSLKAAVQAVGFPCVIKTAAFGYDGKGQIKLRTAEEAADSDYLWDFLGAPPRVVVEKWIPIDSLPCLVLRSNRSINIFETIAVEDIVMAEPIMKPSDNDNPNNDPMITVNINVIAT